MKRNINHNTPHQSVYNSSNVQTAGYDKENGNLHIKFGVGGHYVYHDVPEDVYQAFMMSSSKGSFLHANVKGNFEFTKL
jgi:hypothetical protein